MTFPHNREGWIENHDPASMIRSERASIVAGAASNVEKALAGTRLHQRAARGLYAA